MSDKVISQGAPIYFNYKNITQRVLVSVSLRRPLKVTVRLFLGGGDGGVGGKRESAFKTLWVFTQRPLELVHYAAGSVIFFPSKYRANSHFWEKKIVGTETVTVTII